jgi:hypothetical protein
MTGDHKPDSTASRISKKITFEPNADIAKGGHSLSLECISPGGLNPQGRVCPNGTTEEVTEKLYRTREGDHRG